MKSKRRLMTNACLAEHGHHSVKHDVGLSQICARALNENVCCLQAYAAQMAVDDRGERQNFPGGVRDDWVHLKIVKLSATYLKGPSPCHESHAV